MLGMCFRGEGRQVESRCSNNHVRMVGRCLREYKCVNERILRIN